PDVSNTIDRWVQSYNQTAMAERLMKKSIEKSRQLRKRFVQLLQTLRQLQSDLDELERWGGGWALRFPKRHALDYLDDFVMAELGNKPWIGVESSFRLINHRIMQEAGDYPFDLEADLSNPHVPPVL